MDLAPATLWATNATSCKYGGNVDKTHSTRRRNMLRRLMLFVFTGFRSIKLPLHDFRANSNATSACYDYPIIKSARPTLTSAYTVNSWVLPNIDERIYSALSAHARNSFMSSELLGRNIGSAAAQWFKYIWLMNKLIASKLFCTPIIRYLSCANCVFASVISS